MTVIGIIETNFYLRTAFTEYLSSFSEIKIAFSSAGTNFQTQKISTANAPDVILLGFEQYNQEEIVSELNYVNSVFPQASIILTTVCNEPQALAAFLRFGAKGHIVRTPRLNELTDAICAIKTAGAYLCGRSAVIVRRYFSNTQSLKSLLTPRESEILAHIKTGSSIKQIASILHVSLPTVNFHLKNIYKKLNISSRSELMASFAA